MFALLKPFFIDKEHRLQVYSYIGFLILLIAVLSWLVFEFNDWRGEFFDAIQNRDLNKFLAEMWHFTILAFSMVLISSYGRYLQQRCVLYWRKWMTEHFVEKWFVSIKEGKGRDLENANQRIQEDLRIFTTTIERLAFDGLRNVVTIFIFTPILWSMSAPIEASLGLPHFGMLFWVALIYSGGGMAVSVLIGRKLPRLEYINQRAEAHFRTELVLVDKEVKKASDESRKSLKEVLFADVYRKYKRLYWAYKKFTIWSVCFNQFSVLIPFLIMSPAYFTLQTITLGFIMKADHAFGYIQGGISFVVDRFLEFTELAAVIRRLKEFEGAME